MPASFFAAKPTQKRLIAILSEEKSFIRCFFFSHVKLIKKLAWFWVKVFGRNQERAQNAEWRLAIVKAKQLSSTNGCRSSLPAWRFSLWVLPPVEGDCFSGKLFSVIFRFFFLFFFYFTLSSF